MAATSSDRMRGDFDIEADFLAGAREGQILLQQCDSCAAVQFYPRTTCTKCKTTGLSWIQSKCIGGIYSITEVHRASNPAEMPFTLMLVDLAEGPRLLCRADGTQTGLKIGDIVRVEPAVGPDDQLRFVARAEPEAVGSLSR